MGQYSDLEDREGEYEAKRCLSDVGKIFVTALIAVGTVGAFAPAAIATVTAGGTAIYDRLKRQRERDGE